MNILSELFQQVKHLATYFILFLSVFLSHLVPVYAEGLRIGAIASLQGGASKQGQSWLEGAQLAEAELKNQVQLIVEDDSTTAAKAVSAFHSLTEINKVQAVIGGTWDFLGEAIYPLAIRDSIPLITPNNPPEVLSSRAQKNKFVFTNGLSLAAEKRVIKPFLNYRQFRSVGIVTVQVPFAEVHSSMVREITSQLEIPTISEVEISLDDDLVAFKRAAQKLYRSKPELVYLAADYNQLDLFLTELQNLKWQPTVLTTQHLEGGFELSGRNQERYKNAYSVSSKYDHSKFDQKFLAKFGHPPHFPAVEGYDAVMFFFEAFKNSGVFSSEVKYQGLKGEYSVRDGARFLVEDKAAVVHFSGGKLMEISEQVTLDESALVR